MKVLHINTWATAGGAGRAAYRLHEGLLNEGLRSRIVSRQTLPGRDDLRSWVKPSPLWDRINRMDRLIQIYLGLEALVGLASWAGYRRQARWPDVINLHNLHGYYFSVALLPRLQRAAPLVWTLHDMWPLTGHCAYPGKCKGWLKGCGRCPSLGEPRIERDTTRFLYRVRRAIYARIDPILVAPTRWLLGRARRALLTKRFRSVLIPYGLNTETFRPGDKKRARRTLALPEQGKLILFAAQNMSSRRKGADLLIEALRHLRATGVADVRLVTVGAGGEEFAKLSPYPVLELGRLDDDHLLAAAYSAADLFVLPTRADNLPLVLMESIACGTPCVSFRVGGVPDIVRPGRTGWLAEPEDAADLARCLRQALERDELRERMRADCRKVAVKEYDVRIMARRYVALYEELLETRRRSRADIEQASRAENNELRTTTVQ